MATTKVTTDVIDMSGNTGGLVWAKGATGDQPAVVDSTAGDLRENTATGRTEVFNGTAWRNLKEAAVVLTVEYDYGCVFQSTQVINVTKGYLLVTPNAFSPNEDGINDVLRPLFRGFTSIRMSIFDTWGVLVYFEEGTALEGWNGFVNDKTAENGNYIMYVDGITFFGKEVKKSTPITLLK